MFVVEFVELVLDVVVNEVWRVKAQILEEEVEAFNQELAQK